MKIAVIGSRGFFSRYSGIETSIHETAVRLAASGHEVSIYCRGTRPGAPLASLHPNIRLVYLPSIRSKHLETFVHSFLSTIHVCFTRADVVHFHALGPSLFSLIPRLCGKKTVVTVHALDWKRKKWGFFAAWFLRMCEYPALFFPHRTIAISLSLKEYFQSKFKKEAVCIPNGALVYQNSLRRAQRYILFAGRLVPEKGLGYLIEAFGRIRTDMRLVVAGEPSFTHGYARRLQASSKGNVDFIGFVKDPAALHDLYANAYLFVLPSEVEGSPVSLLEAMGHGVCVLVSDIDEIKEIVGDSGCYFQSRNSKDLEEKLRYLISAPEAVALLGAKGRERVARRYNWDTIAAETEKLYFSLFGK